MSIYYFYTSIKIKFFYRKFFYFTRYLHIIWHSLLSKAALQSSNIVIVEIGSL